MSADIAVTNGRPAIVYAGETPWHTLGARLENPPTAREAIVAAGLDYEVVSVPMFAAAHRIPSESSRRALCATLDNAIPAIDYNIPVPTSYLNVRCDTGGALGVVSDRYKVVQNDECFSFLDSLVAAGDLRYETAGALGRGERVWMLARVPGSIVLPGDDVTNKFLLLSNSHDGGTSLRVLFTSVRVCCANTLSAALNRAGGSGYTFRHVGDITEKLSEARKVLGLAAAYFDEFGTLADRLARARISDDQRAAFFENLYPDPAKGDPAKARQTRMALYGLLEQGAGADLESARGTAWGLLQACTAYVDHHIPVRESGDVSPSQRRLEVGTWGAGSSVKQRAWDLSLAVAGLGSASDRSLFSDN